ncbi:TPA: ImmA/IrrE family metallo-endopeptidase [Streptococcus pyogenes]|uniref:ImmA/IrrE family metallo-endopeptidase n=1 Tax=Streptococcus pyogenes TaxID=1314 RepID=UPI002B3BB960|nr:ImmA/IrrE family metallo-endopeptidase [Streptococcus pyogenes]HEQ3064597.1 ImmA/IrrE family metallo-endopeptidase [Streptococcus pyogenes]HEQ7981474.1 ImmA/IrrE family metallo-endopeptidase [Streptococcus pyogenes]HEQ8956553.1 ImmA/IrrE family metallo-endopeptidase [Streptococcus pyogenes]HEQ9061560.1 ImmA/IrrE family metallo-endopeptidase [Streptococcus pyogenes]
MMTPETVCQEKGIDLVYFDGRGTNIPGMFNKKHNVIAIDTYLDGIYKHKVIYHELGHREHTASYYKLNKEKAELQADRCMIHHLLKEELSYWDNMEDFNYIQFMEKYELTSIADEVMIKEELEFLIS